MRRCALMLLVVIGSTVICVEAPAAESQLVHSVFFETNKDVPQANQTLVAACKKYLSGHPGTVFFAAGVRAEDKTRDVNDLKFDVALHLVFQNKAAHDQYQTSPLHLKFIEENSHLWSNVRVFDSYVSGPSRDAKPGARPRIKMQIRKQTSLPKQAIGFAGMIRGKIVHKRGNRIVVRVERIVEKWEQNKAIDASLLVGKLITVVGRRPERGRLSWIGKFLATLKVGDTVTLDIAHQGGDLLTVVELTEEQRQRVGR